VFVKPTFNRAKRAQLRCYYDVMKRQDSCASISVLSSSQVYELLNWMLKIIARRLLSND